MSTVHSCKRMIIAGLKPKFQSNLKPRLPPSFGQRLKIIPGNTVRPGRYGKFYNVRNLCRLSDISAEIMKGQEGVGIILKICNKLMHMIFRLNLLTGLLKLFPHRNSAVHGLKSCAFLRTESASIPF